MRRATTVLPAGSWDVAEAEGLSVTELTYDERYRRRVMLTDTKGEFLLDLERPLALRDGDGLKLHDGSIILVKAAPERVADIHVHGLAQTARIAWHIGNRHIPVQVLEDGSLRIRHDAVLVEMVEGLGAHVHVIDAPFAPEAGAYAMRPVGHGHDH
jgi:urease accessory protein